MPKDVPAENFWSRAQFFPFRGLAAFHRNASRQAALPQDFVGLAQRRLTECEVVISLSFLAREATSETAVWLRWL